MNTRKFHEFMTNLQEKELKIVGLDWNHEPFHYNQHDIEVNQANFK
jgi:hypothetical protein